VNGPGATGLADVMVVCCSVNDKRFSHEAPFEAPGAAIVTTMAWANEAVVFENMLSRR